MTNPSPIVANHSAPRRISRGLTPRGRGQLPGFIEFYLLANGKLLAGDPVGTGQTTFSSLQ